ncbi:MAG: hypothetical protein GF390_00785 [Candidatus Pacebacteria bacterium]|nr:hypothetical protein [Candidatus Paceibacterota bacterium]
MKKPLKKLLIILLAIFAAANLCRFSADMINNHKLINLVIIGLNILTAGLLVNRWHKSWWHKLLVAGLTLGLTLGGIVDFFPIYHDHQYHLDDYARSEIIQAIQQNTQPNSVFLTTTYLYNPASLAGRKIFLDYGYFAWSLGYNDHQRRQLLTEFFSADIARAQLCLQLKNQQIDYIIISPGAGSLGKEIQVTESVIYQQFKPAFISEDGYRVYEVASECRFD